MALTDQLLMPEATSDRHYYVFTLNLVFSHQKRCALLIIPSTITDLLTANIIRLVVFIEKRDVRFS